MNMDSENVAIMIAPVSYYGREMLVLQNKKK